MVASNHMWLLGTWNVASTPMGVIFRFYLILVGLSLNLNNHMYLVATLLESITLN